MSRDCERSRRRSRKLGRRRLLALTGSVGVSSLAGCADRAFGVFGSERQTIDGEALADLVDGDPPSVPETFPVDIEPSFVDDQRVAAESKLDDVPAPFDEEQIPNGVIRERLNGEYESARESVGATSDAETPYERLGHATRARTSAHEVLAAWRAIESAVTVDDLRESRSAVGDDVDAFASRWSYVGDGPVRAAVVHAEIEREIRGARNWLSFRGRALDRAADNVLDFADLAVDIERARVDVAVGSYLFDRFRAGLDAERDRRERFERARETLRDRIETRRESLPDETDDPTSLVERDIDETAGVIALADLVRDARYRSEETSSNRERDSPSLASAALAAANALVYLRAFESLHERIEDGDDLAVESVADVRSLRADAVDAVRAARDTDRARTVAAAVLPQFAREIRWTDDQLERSSDAVPVDSAARDAAQYVVVAETCRAVPPVSADVAAALRGDGDA